ncbi:hypothetical protein BYT27DRAFT_6464967 [Phlegmacium glaucopus]|nr:hypothetical protein BYT27DRAFT_6464967 [Phlegmacium glaucopus]
MGGAIVTLDAQLVNLDVLPTKFEALTEIVEDWRLCQVSLGFIATYMQFSNINLQQPIIDDDIHDIIGYAIVGYSLAYRNYIGSSSTHCIPI